MKKYLFTVVFFYSSLSYSNVDDTIDAILECVDSKAFNAKVTIKNTTDNEYILDENVFSFSSENNTPDLLVFPFSLIYKFPALSHSDISHYKNRKQSYDGGESQKKLIIAPSEDINYVVNINNAYHLDDNVKYIALIFASSTYTIDKKSQFYYLNSNPIMFDKQNCTNLTDSEFLFFQNSMKNQHRKN